ncbi:STE family protein kinase [Trichomonas vaginalis G3]|uniref:STE family protein kinase n=1 Tax=Trichomonas vaginalis (strain ATCC PRA-98 / G3) TaxID=412133 RepID=A2DXY6_TRIV3|nr:MAP kinase kinase kinase protein [Trichomonas vaginalis G3]EAY14722.1 STE family protein kinase [Trichomonas vaginalis G3]KAI5487907.1 MAP kinase kinase kinase protein [Trichomonas vaginalis G3]|eukprot:XP_001326945.1 STE family protein kinase [Trichomonas vaginalis G3]
MNSFKDYVFSEKIPEDCNRPMVVKALSKTSGKFFAMKYFPAESLKNIEKKTIYRLINVLSSLYHPHITYINEIMYKANPDEAFIALEWCDGSSVKNTLDRFSTLPEKLVGRYTYEIIKGLEFLHSQGQVHKNLKAANLLLASGVLKLSDFGLSAEVSTCSISEHPYWAAPEVIESRTFSNKSDIWSMGATIIELLTGKPPFAELPPEEARIKILNETPPIPAKASAHLQDFLCACFAKNPDERPSTEECYNFFFVKKAMEELGEKHEAAPKTTLRPIPNRLSMLPTPQKDRPRMNIDDFHFSDSDSNEPAKPPKDVNQQHLSAPVMKKTGLAKFENNDDDDSGLDIKSRINSKLGNDGKPKIQIQPTVVTNMQQISRGELRDDDIDDGVEDEDFNFKKQQMPTSTVNSPRRVAFIGIPDEDTAAPKTNQTINSATFDFNNIKTQKKEIEGNDELKQFQDDEAEPFSDFATTEEPLHISLPVQKRVINFDLINDSDENDEELFAHRIEVEEMKKRLIIVIKSISTTMTTEEMAFAFSEVLDIIKKDGSVRSCIIEQQGLMPIIEIIEFGKSLPEKLVLEVIYEIINNHKKLKENFCLLGGIPPVLKFLKDTNYSKEIRSLAMKITSEICRSNDEGQKNETNDNIQMFISCNGIAALVESLQFDIDEESDLVLQSIKSINEILIAKSGIQVSDFCRLFMSAGLIEPLSRVLIQLVNKPKIRDMQAIDTVCEIMHKLSQADTKVKIAMAEKDVMVNIVHCMYDPKTDQVRRELPINDILLLCKAIKENVVSDTRDLLAAAGVMQMACAMVKAEFDKTHAVAIHANLIQVLSSMCKLSKERLEVVARSNLISSLKPYLDSDTELKALVMYMLIDFPKVAFQNKDVMKQLIADKLIEIYISTLTQQYWGARAMAAIAMLASDPDFHVYPILMTPESLNRIRDGIDSVNYENAPTMLQRLNEICKNSKDFVLVLTDQTFLNTIRAKLSTAKMLPSDSQIPVAILELIATIFSDMDKTQLQKLEKSFTPDIKVFADKGNIKQKGTALKILKFFGS